ncbi:MAG: GNAT family N-acetyltransferase [Paracoccaceae bacterium]|nr:GNAT family N-acetyltransferase [Paracoccaceae bacterium]
MERIEISESGLDATGWATALAAIEGVPGAALSQQWIYGEIARAGGRRVRRLVLTCGGRRISLAQAIGRAGLWLISRGPVWRAGVSADQARAGLRALARHLPGLLIATPGAPTTGFGLIPLVTARYQAIWRLGPEPPHLRAGLDGKWRNRLAAAERSGIAVVTDPDPAWLIRAEADQRRVRGYDGLPGDFVTAWGRGARGQVLALRALGAIATPQAGENLAGVVFLRHGSGASYQIGWSGSYGRACGAHNLLLWRAALTLRAQGVRWLDLGDVNSEAGAGLMRFKLGTGAEAVSLGATGLVLPG